MRVCHMVMLLMIMGNFPGVFLFNSELQETIECFRHLLLNNCQAKHFLHTGHQIGLQEG